MYQNCYFDTEKTRTSTSTSTSTNTQAFSALTALGLINLWKFNNNYLESLSSVSLTGQSGTSFTTDRAGASLLAVALSSGQMTIPTGTYFSGSLSITVCAYVLSFAAWSQRVVECGTNTMNQANVIFALQRDLTTYSYFEV